MNFGHPKSIKQPTPDTYTERRGIIQKVRNKLLLRPDDICEASPARWNFTDVNGLAAQPKRIFRIYTIHKHLSSLPMCDLIDEPQPIVDDRFTSI